MTSSPTVAPDRTRGRLLMLAGVGLAVLGVVTYVVQLSLKNLMMPWYMPVLGLLGVAFVVASLWKRLTVWRVLALLVVVLLAGFELAVLNAMRLPSYAGSIAAGRAFPAFEAKRADGSLFTRNDLVGAQNHAIVFFRGRW